MGKAVDRGCIGAPVVRTYRAAGEPEGEGRQRKKLQAAGERAGRWQSGLTGQDGYLE
ncbi:hypothetical protein ATSB10_31560 [Dyella thiooxydans]|uniref:Uncharacterized protein n=1 Tax=Dyella thiooxydans TaxID=445710 RepID=A0A160N3Y7_9GAMM|nr:hypothetical protein ATSB10_31560 [Dyella thiooxydans]